MLFAINGDNTKLRATPKALGYCPQCHASLTAKCGSLKTPHWAHKVLIGDCDHWSEPETEWHREWKSYWPPDQVEVCITRDDKRHRADVHLDNPVGGIQTLEFQHSSISYDDIRSREKFYGVKSLLWVFDVADAYDSRRFWFEDCKGTGPTGAPLKASDWKHGRKSLLACDATIVFDLGSPDPGKPNAKHWLFRVTTLGTYWHTSDDIGFGSHTNERMYVKGYFRTKDQFLKTFAPAPLSKAHRTL